jgi:hypothetical protein
VAEPAGMITKLSRQDKKLHFCRELIATESTEHAEKLSTMLSFLRRQESSFHLMKPLMSGDKRCFFSVDARCWMPVKTAPMIKR